MPSISYTPVKGIQNHVLQKNGRLKSPLSISIEITNACNQDCVFCVQSRQRKAGSYQIHYISLEQLESFLKEARRLGVLELQISGGEPTCHPHFKEVVELVKSYQLRISIITNGVQFSSTDVENLTRVLDPEHDLFIIGLDTAEPENYRALRGQDNFALVCKTLGLMRASRLPFAIQTVILKNNINSLHSVWELSNSYGSRAHILVLPYRIRNVSEDVYPSDEEIRSCLTHLRDDSEHQNANSTPLVFPKMFANQEDPEMHNICMSGRTSCAVSARGEIHVCAYALDCGLSVGNLNDISLNDAWQEIHQFVKANHGISGSLHGHHCPVKAKLSLE
ncbi:MAG: radical SAM/SPASM domain-containing protein [Syntrophorhabdaceae bacterium]